MKVKDLIEHLKKQDPELEVKRDWEGELVDIRYDETREVPTRQYLDGPIYVNYYPELEPDEDETYGRVLLID